MKKIIVAFDGLKYGSSTKDYAISLAKATDAHLVGIFMDDPFYNSYNVYTLVIKKGLDQKQIKKYEEKDKNTRNAAASDFKKSCEQFGLQFSIHRDHKTALQELKLESIYADMLVIDANETLNHYKEKLPTRFIRDLLADVQCPVMVVPAKYTPVKKNILLFDGHPSSVQAIRMFTYLMPEWAALPVEVVTIKEYYENLHVPDSRLMKEFMKRHFPKATYTVVTGDAELEIVKHLGANGEGSMIVLGAYRRGTVSRWFKKSMADVLMNKLKLPLFVAHNV